MEFYLKFKKIHLKESSAKTLHVLRQEYSRRTRLILLLLMPWLLLSPDRQKWWYWLCRIKGSLSSMGKDFNCKILWKENINYIFSCFLKYTQHLSGLIPWRRASPVSEAKAVIRRHRHSTWMNPNRIVDSSDQTHRPAEGPAHLQSGAGINSEKSILESMLVDENF